MWAWGAGRREAPRPGRGFFKTQGWEGPNSGAAPTWLPCGWVGRVVPSGGRYLREAHGSAGCLRPWALGPVAELARPGPPARGADSLHGSEPSAIGSSLWLLGPLLRVPCVREGTRGRLVFLECVYDVEWNLNRKLGAAAGTSLPG